MLLKSNLLFIKSLILRVNKKRNANIYNIKFSRYVSNQKNIHVGAFS